MRATEEPATAKVKTKGGSAPAPSRRPRPVTKEMNPMTNIFTLARRAAPAFALLTIFSILPGPGYTLDVSAAGGQQPDANGCDEQCQQQLAEVREATAQYHQEGRAIEDGFAP